MTDHPDPSPLEIAIRTAHLRASWGASGRLLRSKTHSTVVGQKKRREDVPGEVRRRAEMLQRQIEAGRQAPKAWSE